MNNWAIVGLGFISQRHIDAIKHIDGKILLACDNDFNKRNKLKNVPFFDSYLAMDMSPLFEKVNNIAICTPNYLHIDMAQYFLRRGKRVLCEKPLAINSKELESVESEDNLFTVLQLRHHPVWKELQNKEIKSLELYVKVKRDKLYWQSWKGQDSLSGGILFVIGVHYFDLLLQLVPDLKILESHTTPHLSRGLLYSDLIGKVPCHIEIGPDNKGQERYLLVNNQKFMLSDKDNLSFEDLHKKVYEDFIVGKGIRPRELTRLTEIIEKLNTRV